MEEIKVKDTVCETCDGSGLYCGMAEKRGAAVVCSYCNGTGKVDIEISYRKFKEKKILDGIERVYETNPGIGIGSTERYQLSDFGGMPYDEWFNGGSFPKRSEMRNFSCPAWWYQCANYELKPDWDECVGCGSFSGCENFITKWKCWDRFDKEQK